MTQPYIRSQTSIGGSDVAVILGHSKYKTQAQLYDEIVSGQSDQTTNKHKERGQKIEDIIADLYAETTGFLVRHVNRFKNLEGLPLHYSLDREVVAPPGLVQVHRGNFNGDLSDLGPGIFEAKSHSSWVLKEVIKSGIPRYYYDQIQFYYHGTGYQWAEYVTLDYDKWEPIPIPVPRDQAYIDNMIEQVLTWWERHIVAGIRPDATYLTDEGKEWPMPRFEEPVRVKGAAWASALQALQLAREDFTVAESAKKAAEDAVKELMGDQAIIEYPGIGKVTWKETTSSSFNKEALTGYGAIDPFKLMEFFEHGFDVSFDLNDVQSRIRQQCSLDLNQFVTRKATRRFLPKFDD